MIYIKKENNEIKAFSEQKENSIAITEEQWAKSNYGVYCDIIDNKFTIIEPVIDLEELKKEKIEELKQKRDDYKKENNFSQFVYENLEFNLIEDVDNEKLKWRAFLIDVIEKYDNFKKQIEEATSKKELEKINIDFYNIDIEE